MQNDKFDKLRQKASQLIKDSSDWRQVEYLNNVDELIEELNIYHIELELQNQELHNSNHQITVERIKYEEMYMEAPVAYITLNKNGNIMQLNRAAAKLLGLPIQKYKYTSIFPYIYVESKNKFVKSFKSFFESDKIEYGEITLLSPYNELIDTKLNAVCYYDYELKEKLCRCTFTDISDVKQFRERTILQNKITENEILLDEMGEIANVGGWKINLQNNKLTWTKEVYRIHEIDNFDFEPTIEDAINFYDEKSRKIISNAVEIAIKEGIEFDLELGIITAKQNQKFVRALGKVIYNEFNYPVIVYGTFQDITEQRKYQQILIENEKKLKEAQMIAQMGNWELNIKSNYLCWSDEIYRLFDCEPNEFKATYEAFIEFVHPDDREKVNEAYTNSLVTKEPYEIIHRIISKNNQIKFVKEKCNTTFDENGNPVKSFGIVIDITKLIKAQEKIELNSAGLKELLNLSYQKDADINSILNVALNTAVKLTKSQFGCIHILNKEENKFKINSKSKIDEFGSIILNLDNPEKNTLEFELINNKKDLIINDTSKSSLLNKKLVNESLPITKLLSIPFLNNNNIISIVTLTNKDEDYNSDDIVQVNLLMETVWSIYQKKNDEIKIVDLIEKLEIANSTKNKFFGIIAHDLKGTFSGFINLTDSLTKSFDNFTKEEIINQLQILNHSAKSTYSLLESLLQWSFTQNNTIEFEPEEIDLYELAFDNIYFLKQQASNKNITINNNIQPETYAICDRNLINTVFRNLISNAVKFTDINGKIIINSSTRDNFLEVSIKDNGIGMSEDNLQGLFEIGSDFREKGTNGETGTGLGLILCKEFINKHNGKIWAESELGQGTTFFFTLPI